MPFILVHKKTGEIHAHIQLNYYDIPYYGTTTWEGSRELPDELSSLPVPTQGTLDEWEVAELTADELSMCNVKLGNNPQRSIFRLADGTIIKKQKAESEGSTD